MKEYGGNKKSKGEAGYFPPERGPFFCGRCKFFVAEGEPCQKVAGPIARLGCCNLFEETMIESPRAREEEKEEGEEY